MAQGSKKTDQEEQDLPERARNLTRETERIVVESLRIDLGERGNVSLRKGRSGGGKARG